MQPTQGTLNLDDVIKVMTADPLSKALWQNAQLQVLVEQQARQIAELQQAQAAGNGEVIMTGSGRRT